MDEVKMYALTCNLYRLLQGAYEAGYQSALEREPDHAFGYGFDRFYDVLLGVEDD